MAEPENSAILAKAADQEADLAAGTINEADDLVGMARALVQAVTSLTYAALAVRATIKEVAQAQVDADSQPGTGGA